MVLDLAAAADFVSAVDQLGSTVDNVQAFARGTGQPSLAPESFWRAGLAKHHLAKQGYICIERGGFEEVSTSTLLQEAMQATGSMSALAAAAPALDLGVLVSVNDQAVGGYFKDHPHAHSHHREKPYSTGIQQRALIHEACHPSNAAVRWEIARPELCEDEVKEKVNGIMDAIKQKNKDNREGAGNGEILHQTARKERQAELRKMETAKKSKDMQYRIALCCKRAGSGREDAGEGTAGAKGPEAADGQYSDEALENDKLLTDYHHMYTIAPQVMKTFRAFGGEDDFGFGSGSDLGQDVSMFIDITAIDAIGTGNSNVAKASNMAGRYYLFGFFDQVSFEGRTWMIDRAFAHTQTDEGICNIQGKSRGEGAAEGRVKKVPFAQLEKRAVFKTRVKGSRDGSNQGQKPRYLYALPKESAPGKVEWVVTERQVYLTETSANAPRDTLNVIWSTEDLYISRSGWPLPLPTSETGRLSKSNSNKVQQCQWHYERSGPTSDVSASAASQNLVAIPSLQRVHGETEVHTCLKRLNFICRVCIDCGIWAPSISEHGVGDKTGWPRVYTKFQGIMGKLPCEHFTRFEVCDSPGIDEEDKDNASRGKHSKKGLMEGITRAELKEASAIAVVFDCTGIQKTGQKQVFDVIREVRSGAKQGNRKILDLAKERRTSSNALREPQPSDNEDKVPLIAIGNKFDQMKVSKGWVIDIIRSQLLQHSKEGDGTSCESEDILVGSATEGFLAARMKGFLDEAMSKEKEKEKGKEKGKRKGKEFKQKWFLDEKQRWREDWIKSQKRYTYEDSSEYPIALSKMVELNNGMLRMSNLDETKRCIFNNHAQNAALSCLARSCDQLKRCLGDLTQMYAETKSVLDKQEREDIWQRKKSSIGNEAEGAKQTEEANKKTKDPANMLHEQTKAFVAVCKELTGHHGIYFDLQNAEAELKLIDWAYFENSKKEGRTIETDVTDKIDDSGALPMEDDAKTQASDLSSHSSSLAAKILHLRMCENPVIARVLPSTDDSVTFRHPVLNKTLGQIATEYDRVEFKALLDTAVDVNPDNLKKVVDLEADGKGEESRGPNDGEGVRNMWQSDFSEPCTLLLACHMKRRDNVGSVAEQWWAAFESDQLQTLVKEFHDEVFRLANVSEKNCSSSERKYTVMDAELTALQRLLRALHAGPPDDKAADDGSGDASGDAGGGEGSELVPLKDRAAVRQIYFEEMTPLELLKGLDTKNPSQTEETLAEVLVVRWTGGTPAARVAQKQELEKQVKEKLTADIDDLLDEKIGKMFPTTPQADESSEQTQEMETEAAYAVYSFAKQEFEKGVTYDEVKRFKLELLQKEEASITGTRLQEAKNELQKAERGMSLKARFDAAVADSFKLQEEIEVETKSLEIAKREFSKQLTGFYYGWKEYRMKEELLVVNLRTHLVR
jgi:hypothetical protein